MEKIDDDNVISNENKNNLKKKYFYPKEKIKEYNKSYYYKRKDTDIYTCEICEKSYHNYTYKNLHIKTQKHKDKELKLKKKKINTYDDQIYNVLIQEFKKL